MIIYQEVVKNKMAMLMNNRLLILGIAVLLLAVGLSGCNEIEKKLTGKLVTAPLSTLALTVDDLPQGYIKWTENTNQSLFSTGNISIEEYSVTFAFESHENNTGFPAIALSLAKFNSSDDASIVMYNSSEQISKGYGNLNRITPEDVEQIGDESTYELFQGSMGEYYGYQNTTISLSWFRINNVVVFMFLQGFPVWEIDYTRLTIDYSKIVESRINASLD